MINNTFVMKERQDHFGYKYETRSDGLITKMIERINVFIQP